MDDTRVKLISILNELLIQTGAKGSSLITEDGLIIATNSNQSKKIEEFSSNFASISASILSMAERGIEIINENKNLEEIRIDAGFDQNTEEDFTILITRVASNVLLQVIYAKRINIGLIQFESNNAIKKIRNLMKDTSIEVFLESIGSLL